jgi:hypothetical protein
MADRRGFVAWRRAPKPDDPEWVLIQYISYYKSVLAFYRDLTPEQHDFYTKKLGSYCHLLEHGDPNNMPAN